MGTQRRGVRDLTLCSSSSNIRLACVACRLNTVDTPSLNHFQRTCPRNTPRRAQILWRESVCRNFVVRSPLDKLDTADKHSRLVALNLFGKSVAHTTTRTEKEEEEEEEQEEQ
jgi:hypothetical protein